jgi:hypothetical protein
VSRWDESDNIIRVFTQIIDNVGGSSLVEWKWWGVTSGFLDICFVHSPPLLDEANSNATSLAAD